MRTVLNKIMTHLLSPNDDDDDGDDNGDGDSDDDDGENCVEQDCALIVP